MIATTEQLVSISKTPPGEQPFDPAAAARKPARPTRTSGRFVYHLVDTIAERYLDLVDSLDDEIDELEDLIVDRPVRTIAFRLRELRHDVRGIRRTLAPTRDAVHKIVDNRIELTEGRAVPAGRRDCASATPTTSSCAPRKGSSRRATSLAGCARLRAGEDRERPERGDEAADA